MKSTMMASVLGAVLLGTVGLAGCSRQIENAVAELEAAPGEEWTMRVLGDDADRVFLVVGPDGKHVGARLKGGASTLLEDAEAMALIGKSSLVSEEPPPEKLSITTPGATIKIGADEEGNGDRGRVQISAGGVDINVAGDSTGGDSGEVAIQGVNATAAGKFIDDIEELSPEVKQKMREKLGL